MRHGFWGALVFALLLAPFAVAQSPVPKPSFDCARARTRVPLLICGNAGLARLDAQEADLLRRARAAATDPGAINAEEDQWLGYRNGCDDIPCVADAYRRRMQELHRWVN